MNPYSEDLPKKIVEALRRGTAKSEAARSFGVSRSSVKRYAKLAEEGRSLAPKKRPGSQGPRWTRECPEALLGSGSRRTPRGHPLRASGVLETGGGTLGQRVHREQDGQAPRVQSKKRSLGADERDE